MRKLFFLVILSLAMATMPNSFMAPVAPTQQPATPTPPLPTWTPGPPPPKTPVPSPSPTWTPVSPINRPRPGGGQIELRVQFAPTWWQRQTVHWQELWTVIQWQDYLKNWHVVEGWQGGLDEIVKGEGWKTWWVIQSDLGKGPFRWLVYEGPGGKLLAKSEPFNLPQAAGQTIKVQIMLNP
jgi:hypothetical protein